MSRLVFACVVISFLIGNAAAQSQSEHCIYLKSEIERLKKSLNGLRGLVSGDSFVVLRCIPRRGETWEVARARCDQMPDNLGTWRDTETNTVYGVFTKQFVADYVHNKGSSPEQIARALNRSEAVKDKVERAGIISLLEGEIPIRINEYETECVRSGQTQPPPDVAPPPPPRKKRWF